MARNDHSEKRLVVGCMTGTSLDALDAALVEINGRGLTMRARVVAFESAPLGELGPHLRALAGQEPMSAGAIAALNREFSLLHARTVLRLVPRGGDGGLSFICAHGQTIFHAPPLSWQLLSPAVLAAETGTDVWSDLRSADLAAGGQGAPITPMADFVLFRFREESRAIVNLGGFCNVTTLFATRPDPSGKAFDEVVLVEGTGFRVRGSDVCACNHLLDCVARQTLGSAFDEGGRAALAGRVDDAALNDLQGVLAAQSASRRSLGTGDEAVAWVDRHRTRLKGDDLAATACEGLGRRIAAASGAQRVILAGGGVRNLALVRAIRSHCDAAVDLSDEHRIPAHAREAVAMGVLGALCADGVQITLSGVTGRRRAALSGVLARGGGNVA
ncbi:MAG: anhydro-N-acetylmuramic acid kinase [Phycisphaerales bacterium]